MAVNRILTRGARELRPSHNLSAQLPFSDYAEGCSAHLSNEEDSNKNTSVGTVRPGRRSEVGWVSWLNTRLAENQFSRTTRKVSWPQRELSEYPPDAKSVLFISSEVGSLLILLSLSGLKHHRWPGHELHMFWPYGWQRNTCWQEQSVHRISCPLRPTSVHPPWLK